MLNPTMQMPARDRQATDRGACQVNGHPALELAPIFCLWSPALRRMHPQTRNTAPKRVPILEPRWEQVGAAIGVDRREFESDWAFCRYLQIRLGYIINCDLQRQLDKLWPVPDARPDGRLPGGSFPSVS